MKLKGESWKTHWKRVQTGLTPADRNAKRSNLATQATARHESARCSLKPKKTKKLGNKTSGAETSMIYILTSWCYRTRENYSTILQITFRCVWLARLWDADVNEAPLCQENMKTLLLWERLSLQVTGRNMFLVEVENCNERDVWQCKAD